MSIWCTRGRAQIRRSTTLLWLKVQWRRCTWRLESTGETLLWSVGRSLLVLSHSHSHTHSGAPKEGYPRTDTLSPPPSGDGLQPVVLQTWTVLIWQAFKSESCRLNVWGINRVLCYWIFTIVPTLKISTMIYNIHSQHIMREISHEMWRTGN